MFAFFGYSPRTTAIRDADEFTIGWGGRYRVCLHITWGGGERRVSLITWKSDR